MFRNYYQVRDWLEDFIPLVYGKEELGLARIEYLLEFLGNPQNKFKSIHIAGTSGKGSTAFYTAKLLATISNSNRVILGSKTTPESSFFVDSGQSQNDKKRSFKIGLHVSPHLIDIRERMQILDQVENDSNSLMPMKRFVKLFNEIKLVVEQVKKTKPELAPSYFEILVAASFKYFADEKVDWAVVEVGLGGRLDATNVLKPEISVITNIGLDHTELLGKTVEKIAWEKAGIIKSGVPVVTAATGKALKVIEKIAKENGSNVIKVNTQKLAKELSIEHFSDGPFLAYATIKTLTSPCHSGLSRKYVLLCRSDSGVVLLPRMTEIKKVFLEQFPGRFEEIDEGVIIDGAHNPDKIRALLEFVRNFELRTSNFEIILVVAFKKGKNWKKMVDLLVKNLPIKKVVATKFYSTTDTGKYAAVSPKEIADYAKSKWKETVFLRKSKVESFANSQEAVFEALRLRSGSSTLILITGSLYLVGETRTLWYLPNF